jgi:bacillithiol synthase
MSLTLPLSRYPGMNRFVLDRLAGDERATRFIPQPSMRARGPRPASQSLRDALLASNASWGIDARASLDAWADGATTFIAGQQVGFAGGPLYTLSKLATLLRMKHEAESRGERAVVMFWLATEDHDFDEVSQLALPANLTTTRDAQRDLVYLHAHRTSSDRAMVGRLPIPESLRTQLIALLGIEPPQWLAQGTSFRESFAQLMASVFGDRVVLVDALLPELRREGGPLFAALSSKLDAAQAALAERSDAIRNAGYTPQIAAREHGGYTFFFEIDNHGDRNPVERIEGIEPERISTSAVTRPLLQDVVLQPDVFVGGPAEVAYYAQVAALHPLVGAHMPRVALRGHALVAPPRVFRHLERLELDPADVFGDVDSILEPHESERAAALRAFAAEAEEQQRKQLERIRELALPADRSLAKSIDRSAGHLQYHLRKMTERSLRAVVRRDDERTRAVREIVSTFYPDRQVQERVVSWYAWYARSGSALVTNLAECVGPDRADCALVSV